MEGVVNADALTGVWNTFPTPDGRANGLYGVEAVAYGTEIVATVVTNESM
jgi:hypothetical protein